MHYEHYTENRLEAAIEKFADLISKIHIHNIINISFLIKIYLDIYCEYLDAS